MHPPFPLSQAPAPLGSPLAPAPHPPSQERTTCFYNGKPRSQVLINAFWYQEDPIKVGTAPCFPQQDPVQVLITPFRYRQDPIKVFTDTCFVQQDPVQVLINAFWYQEDPIKVYPGRCFVQQDCVQVLSHPCESG